MCAHGDTVSVPVMIPGDLSHTGAPRWTKKPIDRCISGLVRALNRAGIYTRSSCCGHGRANGEILLEDGRRLEVHLPIPSSAPVG